MSAVVHVSLIRLTNTGKAEDFSVNSIALHSGTVAEVADALFEKLKTERATLVRRELTRSISGGPVLRVEIRTKLDTDDLHSEFIHVVEAPRDDPWIKSPEFAWKPITQVVA